MATESKMTTEIYPRPARIQRLLAWCFSTLTAAGFFMS